MKRFDLKVVLIALWTLVIAGCGPAIAQIAVPGQPTVPLGFCQQTLSGTPSGFSSCTRASFTATAGSNNTQLVVTSVTGIINVGDQIVSGTGLTGGTIITGQVSGTPGGAGTYQLSATNTASAASATSGGIPAGATMVYITVATNNALYRDDGAPPTTTVGIVIASGGSLFYAGTLSQMKFVAATGSPVLNVAFYR